MSTCILWFRNNLRLGDNMPVMYAYNNYDSIIPVFIQQGSLHMKRFVEGEMGNHRKTFLLESILDLKGALKAQGSDLLYLEENDATATLIELAQKVNANAIVGPKEFAYREVQEEAILNDWGKKQNTKVKFFNERTLYTIDRLPFGLENLPEVFSRFRGKVEKRSTPHDPIEEPSISSIHLSDLDLVGTPIELPRVSKDHRTAVPFSGGIVSGWEQLDYYLWETEGILRYKETRNGMVGRDFSSKFSPFLALGCLSARQIYAEVQRFEDEVEANDSTYWLFFELLWREYFQWIALKHGKELFSAHGLQPEKPLKQGFNKRAFEKWINGNTGDPLVDANMNELAATGFMSNRGRQNVASYLVHDMGIDWRAGAAYFEQQLIDYDPASNYGNWLYNAGRGNDPRPFRKFNTKFQAERYDPDGSFVNTWR